MASFKPGAVFWHSLTACLVEKKGFVDKLAKQPKNICEFSFGIVVVLIL